MDELKKELKLVLFESVVGAYKEWQGLQKRFSEGENPVIIAREKYNALYRVIEDSGLEDEFSVWKMEQERPALVKITYHARKDDEIRELGIMLPMDRAIAKSLAENGSQSEYLEIGRCVYSALRAISEMQGCEYSNFVCAEYT